MAHGNRTQADLKTKLVVTAMDAENEERAAHLAEHLLAPLAEGHTETNALQLRVSAHGLSLFSDGMELQPDFASELPRLAPNRLHRELLVRAAKTKGTQKPHAFDATAGLGEDSLLLAAAGFTVDLYENDPAIAALLEDAVDRAAADPRLAQIVGRMRVHEADSIEALSALADNAPDVVYLDPMFPERRKSAAVKKKFQLLHHLERPCSDESELLDAALRTGARKVVVKRPVKGPHLAGRKPSYSIAGKSVRYDVYVQ